MCCVFAILLTLGPRFGIFFWWLYDPTRWNVVFGGGFVVPFLGFLLLPWTTLMYILVAAPVGGITFWGWLRLALGLLTDIGSHMNTYASRNQRSRCISNSSARSGPRTPVARGSMSSRVTLAGSLLQQDSWPELLSRCRAMSCASALHRP